MDFNDDYKSLIEKLQFEITERQKYLIFINFKLFRYQSIVEDAQAKLQNLQLNNEQIKTDLIEINPHVDSIIKVLFNLFFKRYCLF